MVAAAADASVKTVLRYDLNIAQGIIHTLKEYAVTDVVIGLHRKTNPDGFILWYNDGEFVERHSPANYDCQAVDAG